MKFLSHKDRNHFDLTIFLFARLFLMHPVGLKNCRKGATA